ncbi:MAG: tetratricopeptide repeat protein [Gammaproteobacteria bacterium]|nr:tetratricopeptide repeat protein [Gammaproteobacteria bacterium]
MFRLIKNRRWPPALGCWLALTTAAANVTEDPLYRRALEQFSAGDLEGSHRLFKQLEEDHPDNPGILNNLGIIAARLGQFDLAARLLEKAIATDPAIATSHRNLRALYAHRASQAYKRALSLDSVEVAAPQYEAVGAAAAAMTAASATTGALSDVVLSATELEKPLIEEPEETPAPPARDTADGDALIAASIERWARAWAGKDLDGYFASYAPDYRPRAGADHESWRRQRRERILGPRRISVEISNLAIRDNDGDSAQVVFQQAYRSNLLASTVIKRMSLQNTGDGWKITRERVIRRQ